MLKNPLPLAKYTLKHNPLCSMMSYLRCKRYEISRNPWLNRIFREINQYFFILLILTTWPTADWHSDNTLTTVPVGYVWNGKFVFWGAHSVQRQSVGLWTKIKHDCYYSHQDLFFNNCVIYILKSEWERTLAAILFFPINALKWGH